MMSAELFSVSGPGPDGSDAGLQGTTVGGRKPLHRFLKGQPKIIGIVVLVLGASLFINSIAIVGESYGQFLGTSIPPGFFLGTMFMLCGILFILTEHNPTKKTVTISLALSIVTILGAFWTVLLILPNLRHVYGHYDLSENNETDDEVWASRYEAMGITLEMIFVFYSFVGTIIFIIMSTFAGAALRSTKSQAIVVLNAVPAATPAEMTGQGVEGGTKEI